MRINVIFWAIGVTVLFSSLSFSQEDDTKKHSVADQELLLIQEHTKQQIEDRKSEFDNAFKHAVISGSDTTTLMSLSISNKPLLSVGTFNSNLMFSFKFQWQEYLDLKTDEKPKVDVSKIKKNLAFSIAEDAFLRDQWNTAKKERLFNDSLQNRLNFENHQNRGKNSDSLMDSIMSAKYKAYYNHLFTPRNQSIFNVIATTDSILLDSLLLATTNSGDSISKCKTNSKHSRFQEDYLSDNYRYDSLPKELRLVADSLKAEQWSQIVKCIWGYAAISLNVHSYKREVTLNEAYADLLLLPDYNQLSFMIPDANLKLFFEEHKCIFQEDTFIVSIKLFPNIYRQTGSGIVSAIAPHEKIPEIQCTDRDLPSNVRLFIVSNPEFKKNKSTEWMDIQFGKWKIKLLDIRKGKKVTFDECRNVIAELQKTALIQRQLERVQSINTEKQEEKSLRFFRDFFYANTPGRYSNGILNSESVYKINEWALHNISNKMQ